MKYNILSIISITLLIISVVYLMNHEEPKRSTDDMIIYTDDYCIYQNTDSVLVCGKTYKVKCRVTANKFIKPGKDKSGYYEKLFYIKNDTIYKVTDHDHEDMIEVSSSKIIGDTLYCDKIIQDKVAPIPVKYRIASDINPYPFHSYFTIIDGIVIDTCHKDFTGWMIFGIILSLLSGFIPDSDINGVILINISGSITILIGFLCFW